MRFRRNHSRHGRGDRCKIVASPLVKLPYVLVTRKEIRRPEDLKGKAMGIARAGDLSDRLSRAVVKKFGLAPDAVTIRPIGGSQGERYQAMAADIVQGVIITPPSMSAPKTKATTCFIA